MIDYITQDLSIWFTVYIAHAPQSLAQPNVHYFGGLAWDYHWTDFEVDSSKFLWARGPHVKTVFRPQHVQPAPLADGDPPGNWFKVLPMCPASMALPVTSGWPVALTKNFVSPKLWSGIACATKHRANRGQHQKFTSPETNQTVPLSSRSVHPFWLQVQKSLDKLTHILTYSLTDKQVQPNFFSATHQWEFPDAKACYRMLLILQFWMNGRLIVDAGNAPRWNVNVRFFLKHVTRSTQGEKYLKGYGWTGRIVMMN